jgi:hypothetical protein
VDGFNGFHGISNEFKGAEFATEPPVAKGIVIIAVKGDNNTVTQAPTYPTYRFNTAIAAESLQEGEFSARHGFSPGWCGG